MKIFSGFPQGKLEVTPLPNLFFSELLPMIDDAAELKVTLHIFWLSAHYKTPRVRVDDLRADRTLMQSLKAIASKPADALKHGLDLATERGTLLNRGDDYFVNTDRGRRAFEKAQAQETTRESAREPAHVEERPNIFILYEKSFGLLLTPVISDELRELEQEYPIDWIAEALKETAIRGNKNLKYTRKILERWKTEGRIQKSQKRQKWWSDEYDKYIKR